MGLPICPLDVTYCSNAGCQISQCERHPAALLEIQRQYPGCTVSVADLSGTCRDYIRNLVEGKSHG